MKRKHLLIIWVLILIIALSSVACESSQGEEEKDDNSKKSSLVIVEPNEWLGMDTLQTAYYTSMQTLVADPLLMRNDEGDIVPCLASDYDIAEDGKSITLTIPEGLKFATGEPLLPEDVKASIQHGLELSPMNADYSKIQSIEIDGNKVILYLDQYSSSVLYYLTWQYISVIDEDQINSLNEDELLWSAVPYGLYTLKEFVPGSHAEIVPNKHYKTSFPGVINQGEASVSQITVKFMGDMFSIVQGLKAGEIDIAFQVSFDNLDEFIDNEEFEIHYNEPAFGIYMFFNNDNPILEDDNVCEALMLLINREQIEEQNSMYKTSYSHVVDNMIGFDQEIYDYFKDNYSNNPEKAQQLLEEAGYTNLDKDGYLVDEKGNRLEFTTIFYHPQTQQLAELLQIQMKNVGIMMNIEQVDFSVWDNNVTSEKFDAAIGLYGADYGGGANITYRLRDPNMLDQGQTKAFYDSVERFETIQDPSEASKELANAQKIMVDSLRCFPFMQLRTASVYRKDVKGLKFLSTQGGIVLVNDVEWE